MTTEPEPNTLLDVSPRYLAGTGSETNPVARAVLAFDWRHDYNRELDQTFVSSPDHRFRIGMGQLDPGAWWRITAAREPLGPPQWMAAFSKDTPEEMVAAVTEALHVALPRTDWTGAEHPALQEGAFDGDAFLDALVAAGWRDLGEPHGVRSVWSPDYLVRAELRRGADPLDLMGNCALAVLVGPEEVGDPYWQALFTADTPALVTNAFVRTLVDPAPLRRDADLMDEHLLAHLGYTVIEDGLVPVPPPYTDEDLTRAAAHSLARLLAAADGHLTVGEVLDELADQPLPSTETGPGPATTWGQLPPEQQQLAAMLTLDLVADAARYSHRLLGLHDDATGRVWQYLTRGNVPAVPIADLRFTNDDLYAAAGTIAAYMIATTDDPSGILEGFHGEPIASRASEETVKRFWDEHPDHVVQPAYDEICRRFTAVHDSVGDLFAPGMPQPPALVSAAPAYLAGPGHTTATSPAAPLLAAGWSRVEIASGDVYLSPCGRIRTTAVHAPAGTSWNTAYTDPASGDQLWHITADVRTPAEITAAIHQALAATQAAAPADLRYPALSGGLEPLTEAGWFMDNVPGYIIWNASDETASVERATSASALADGANPHWVISGGDLQPGGPGWYIEMADRVPRPMLTAVAAALTNTEPVTRLARQIPQEHRADMDIVPLEWRPADSAGDRAAAARRRPLDGKGVTANGPLFAEASRTQTPVPRRRTP
ncbi:DUF317 domain-containing protein [Kitasatospora sp. YST-16]|uniref:DUF317 domain-containing protein n=1 Tax=Kitasatospora sp. YST-16 TaxID=2998080 RepID=UPI0022844B59|nr:DUF317 domain-containing protein [Kitasatospora sp. YST-16]WAL76545.1 DUF317 domain-containing protein [Kitasatospora sp. YST-16]WNW42558.1 DUF317 domain-containing protein [Streptomyces sp. Li-HN-5-13]